MTLSSSVRRNTRLAALRLLAAATRVSAPARGDIRRLLVIRPDHLGDLLFATPAFRRLREALPEAEIVALVGPWGTPVVERNRSIDSHLAWDIPWFNRRARGGLASPYVSAARLGRLLRSQRFDAAIDLRFDFWWGALAAQLAGIPRRCGYSVSEVRPFLTLAVPYEGRCHEVERNLALVEAFLGPKHPSSPADSPAFPFPLEFPIQDEEASAAERLLATKGIGRDEPVLAVHPGAGAALKRWSSASFARVADSLADRLGARVVLTGGPAEAQLVKEVAGLSRSNPVSLAGETSLGTLASVFRRSRLVLGTDSGPLHVAVAVGAPTVHIFGPVDHRAFGPWGPPERHAVVRVDLPCSPCDRLDRCTAPGASRECMLSVSPERVLAAAERVLEATD